MNELFWLIDDTYAVGNKKTTINNKVRAIE